MLLGVDVGGTFTDAVLVDGDGRTHSAKVPSTPQDQALGVLQAVSEVLAQADAQAADVERFAHGMTVATNALLEGRTARAALVATAGFTDVLELGRQARASLYRLCESAPEPLAPAELRLGARERCVPEGAIVALDREQAGALADELAALGPDSVAVALLHSYAHPEHERALGELLRERLGPGTHVSLSSELVGTFREFERTATTVLDAAVSPLVGNYLGRLARRACAQGLPEPEVMQSSGGLTTAARAGGHGAVTVLSGPAGGVGGALLLAGLAGSENVLCFDMGGTSCDVCVITGAEVAETAGREVAGSPLALPALDIDTVGAGGGSIAWRDAGGALRVGPSSAGAVPGPACYGRGGELPTVTDANLLLGRLREDVPLAGELWLDRAAAARAVGALASELGLDEQECAAGIVRVAEAEMLRALRVMTIERGIDPREYALMPFGGAGPLHACALAQELGMTRVLCPRSSGVLCALGLAAAAPRRDASRTVMLTGEDFSEERVAQARAQLLEQATGLLEGVDGAPASTAARVRTVYELRYRGQSFELSVESGQTAPELLREEFAQAHERRYGYREQEGEVELVTMRVSVWGEAPLVHPRVDAAREQAIEGPCTLELPEATAYVARGWRGAIDEWGTLCLERA